MTGERRRGFAAAFVPFMVRLTLAMVFIVHGYFKLFHRVDPSPNQARVLAEIGVIEGGVGGDGAKAPTPNSQDQAADAADSTQSIRKLYLIAVRIQGWGWPIPAVFAWVVALTEFVGAILLLLGLLSRIAALGLCTNMLVAIINVHWTGWNIFHQDWLYVNGGWAFPAVLALLSFSILLAGPGLISVDKLISRGFEHSGHEESEEDEGGE